MANVGYRKYLEQLHVMLLTDLSDILQVLSLQTGLQEKLLIHDISMLIKKPGLNLTEPAIDDFAARKIYKELAARRRSTWLSTILRIVDSWNDSQFTTLRVEDPQRVIGRLAPVRHAGR